MSNADEVTDANGERADGWRELNAFAIIDADGWIISRYTVQGIGKYLLWGADGKPRGPFDDIGASRRRSINQSR
jgi:hypothetical protein